MHLSKISISSRAQQGSIPTAVPTKSANVNGQHPRVPTSPNAAWEHPAERICRQCQEQHQDRRDLRQQAEVSLGKNHKHQPSQRRPVRNHEPAFTPIRSNRTARPQSRLHKSFGFRRKIKTKDNKNYNEPKTMVVPNTSRQGNYS